MMIMMIYTGILEGIAFRYIDNLIDWQLYNYTCFHEVLKAKPKGTYTADLSLTMKSLKIKFKILNLILSIHGETEGVHLLLIRLRLETHESQ